MIINILKLTSLSLVFTLFIQCQAKNTTTESYFDSNYKELSELLKNSPNNSVNFVSSAALATPCVVHIKTRTNVTTNYVSPYQDRFGNEFLFEFPQTKRQEASGSGVIISSDGYIATNLHVIQNAEEIIVNLRNKNEYKARVIGYDEDTDIALLKIDEVNLPFLQFANSDQVMVGEWVLAVGNPFNLESTVTQGIVSAKGRSLNMQKNNGVHPIESFIQTDAAVNPGNSGGALVNLKGELIGINTAIASPTGTYAGYAFAVPSNLVKKVIADLKQYGMVQRAYLGISAIPLTSTLAHQLSLSSPNGVLIHQIGSNTSAAIAGLLPYDVIVKIDKVDISTFPELLEHISNYSPGDKVTLTYIRKNKKYSTQVILKNKYNTTEIQPLHKVN